MIFGKKQYCASVLNCHAYQSWRSILPDLLINSSELNDQAVAQLYESLTDSQRALMPSYTKNWFALGFRHKAVSLPALYLCFHSSNPLLILEEFTTDAIAILQKVSVYFGVRHLVIKTDKYGDFAIELLRFEDGYDVKVTELRKASGAL